MNKFSKGRIVGVVAACLSAVSLMGIGFSTWIIEAKNTATTGDISVTVADTKDISVTISDASVTDGTVIFDANATDHTSDSILNCASGDKEDLTFTLSYKVNVAADAKSWQIMAGINDTDGNYTTAVNTRKYIALPSTLGLKTTSTDGSKECLNQGSTSGTGLTITSSTSTTDSSTTYTVSQSFTFSWGEAFASMNPVKVTKSNNIYTQENETKPATVETLTANTKAMKNLGLSKFQVVLSVGTVSL